MSTHGFFCQDVERTTLDPTIGTCKAPCDDFVLKPQCFEDLSTFVTRESTDTHFRHNLQHAFRDCLTVESDDLVVVESLEQSVPGGLP